MGVGLPDVIGEHSYLLSTTSGTMNRYNTKSLFSVEDVVGWAVLFRNTERFFLCGKLIQKLNPRRSRLFLLFVGYLYSIQHCASF